MLPPPSQHDNAGVGKMEYPSSSSSEDPPTASPNASILLQKAKRWTSQHLDVARVKAMDSLSTEEIFGAEYVPADGDPGMLVPHLCCCQSTDDVVPRTRRAVSVHFSVSQLKENWSKIAGNFPNHRIVSFSPVYSARYGR